MMLTTILCRIGFCWLLIVGAGQLLPKADAQVRLARHFSSGMVLPHDSVVPIRGWGEPGAKLYLTADWMADELSTTVDEKGRFEIPLQTPGPGGPHRLTLTGADIVILDDVLIGEVWLASGQSNMEMRLRDHAGVKGADEAKKRADHPRIRVYRQAWQKDIAPREDLTSGTWRCVRPDNVEQFSAVGYFFAEELQRELDIPIGILEATWGGTPAESWVSESSLRRLKDFDDSLDDLAARRDHPETHAARKKARLDAWEKSLQDEDPGFKGAWFRPDFDDSAWDDSQEPKLWSGSLAKFDGAIWYRFSFDLDEAPDDRDAVVALAPIDDQDRTWLNGRLIGRTQGPGSWQKDRLYRVKAGILKKGRNVLTVRALDTGGGGGFRAKEEKMRLHYSKGGRHEEFSLAGRWKRSPGIPLAKLPKAPNLEPVRQNTPSAIFNGMIAPLRGFPFQGAIWYQGESNVGRALQYSRLFPTLIEDWRKHFDRKDLPFYFVQIAPFAYGRANSAPLREAQRRTLALPHTGMVVTLDVGEARDIHPRDKKPVGKRLADLALAYLHGRKDRGLGGGSFSKLSRDGDTLELSFDRVQGALEARGPLEGFEIQAADGTWHVADVEVSNKSIRVRSEEVKEPRAVRYAWTNTPRPVLFDRSGLPVSSFTTDPSPEALRP